jgi:hypothetical protein
MRIDNKEIVISGRMVKTASLKDEWYDSIEDPEGFTREMKDRNVKADIFTFWQRLNDTQPRYDYYSEEDPAAVIPVKSYEHWLNHQIDRSARKAVRKAEKSGVFVKVVELDDRFVEGVVSIFNETPIRQGRPYRHYGMNADAVKRELTKDKHRSDFIGAYHDEELIGFIQLGNTGISAIPFGMVSKIAHRDKAPQNALLAKAIEVCEKKGIPYLLYGKWLSDSLGDFKRHNGCVKMDLSRYYIPLNLKGAVVLRLQLHHGLAERLPIPVKNHLKALRKKLYTGMQNKKKQERTEESSPAV